MKEMDTQSLILLLISSSILLSTFPFQIVAERVTKIHARGSNMPAEEGNILALHCEVSNFKVNEQEVSILRITNGKTERLAMGNNVMPDVDERIFLATRQLDAGSTVYFLTIIRANRNDKGKYVCKVIKDGISTEEIAVSSVNLDILYFPGRIKSGMLPTGTSWSYGRWIHNSKV